MRNQTGNPRVKASTRRKERGRLASLLFGGSVLRRLTLSSVSLIAVLALVIGLSSHAISSGNYRQQVAELNHRLINRYALMIQDNVIDEAKRVHQDLCLNLTLKTDLEVLFEEDYDIVKVKRLHGELLKIVSASGGRIEAIHIRSLPNRFHISSMLGFKDDSEINRKTLPNLYWAANADQESERAIWMPARTIHYSSADKVNVVSYVATYPSTQPFSRAKGIITIDLREDYLKEVLGRVSPQDTRQLLIADSGGNLVTHDSKAIPGKMTDLGYPDPQSLLATDWTDKVLTISGSQSMTSRIRLSNGWTLLQSVPLREFNAVSRTIALINAGLCGFAALIAIWIARRFARRIYLPLASITERLRRLLRLGEQERLPRDEYAVLDRAVTEMQSQLVHMSGLKARSLPLLREKLLHALLGGTVHHMEEYERILQQLGLDALQIGGSSVVLLLDWSHPACWRDPEGGAVSLTEDQIGRVAEQVTDRMGNDAPLKSGLVLAGLVSGTRLALLSIGRDPLSADVLDAMLVQAQETLCVCASLGVGSRRMSPLEADVSFRDAEQALAYRFFHPDRQVFDLDDYPYADSGADPEKGKWVAGYVDALKTNSLQEARVLIADMIRATTEGEMAAPARRDLLLSAFRAMLAFARGIHVNAEDPLFQLRNPMEQLPDVHAFRSWWLQATERLLELKQSTARHTTQDVVDGLKRHIAENLSDELSLTRLSEHTGLSKSYLSHIFKEETGINLINYITDQRMAEAKKLLLQAQLNIETIARRLGYETPHYFSKKFRQYYGVPPSTYRINPGEVQ